MAFYTAVKGAQDVIGNELVRLKIHAWFYKVTIGCVRNIPSARVAD